MNQDAVSNISAYSHTPQDSKIEKRRCHRARRFKGGRIVVGRGNATIDCIIRDMTETGARLRIDSQLGVPKLFDLVAVSANHEFKCEIAWRCGFDIGVRFIEAAD